MLIKVAERKTLVAARKISHISHNLYEFWCNKSTEDAIKFGMVYNKSYHLSIYIVQNIRGHLLVIGAQAHILGMGICIMDIIMGCIMDFNYIEKGCYDIASSSFRGDFE